jgi:bacillithiol system protein YtxJ
MMAKKKFEMDADSIPAEIDVYYLDLLNYRDVSNTAADLFQVHHESPQILVIKNGECIFESSHGEISAEEAAAQLA